MVEAAAGAGEVGSALDGVVGDAAPPPWVKSHCWKVFSVSGIFPSETNWVLMTWRWEVWCAGVFSSRHKGHIALILERGVDADGARRRWCGVGVGGCCVIMVFGGSYELIGW